MPVFLLLMTASAAFEIFLATPFYFAFGDKMSRRFYVPLLYMEVLWVLINGALIWLLFREPPPPEPEPTDRGYGFFDNAPGAPAPAGGEAAGAAADPAPSAAKPASSARPAGAARGDAKPAGGSLDSATLRVSIESVIRPRLCASSRMSLHDLYP